MKKIHSIRNKLLGYFFVLCLIFLGTLSVFYYMAIEKVYDVASESVEKSLTKANIDTSEVLSEAERIGYIVAGDANIQKSFREELPMTMKEVYKERLSYNYEVLYMNRFVEYIDGMYVMGENGAFYRSSEYSPKLTDFREKEWYKTVIKTKQSLWIKPHEGSEFVRNLDAMTISVAVPIKDRASSKILGVVVIDILAESLKQIEYGGLVFEGKTYILDEKNKIIYSDTENLYDYKKNNAINKALSKVNFNSDITKDIVIDNEKYLLSGMNLQNNDWKVIGLISYEEMFDSIQIMKSTMICTIVIFIFAAITFAVIGSNNISRPIRKIRTTMKLVEKGNFEVGVEANTKDEVGELAISFNHMVKKISILMKNEQDNQEKLRLAEFKALQSQINPHFLYNTLDSINWMARMNRVEKVEEMIDALTTLLRIGLSRGKNFITIKEELFHVENYIAIQKNRYERILGSEINVPSSVYEYDVIKMILQPLVENAIYHGIKEKGEVGKIIITAQEDIDTITFCVQDTGLGMKREKLDEIQSMMDIGIDYNKNAYGVINVQKRIQMYFGKEYGLVFESEWKKGTKVYVKIPKRKGVDADAKDSDS